jgi:hypothetical protein
MANPAGNFQNLLGKEVLQWAVFPLEVCPRGPLMRNCIHSVRYCFELFYPVPRFLSGPFLITSLLIHDIE